VQSEEGSEAHLVDNAGDEFVEYECSDNGARTASKDEDEQTVQFPAEERECSKRGACFSGRFNFALKSQKEGCSFIGGVVGSKSKGPTVVHMLDFEGAWAADFLGGGFSQAYVES